MSDKSDKMPEGQEHKGSNGNEEKSASAGEGSSTSEGHDMDGESREGMMSSQRRKMDRRMMMEMDFPMKKDMMRRGMNRMRPPRGMMDEMDRDMYDDMHADMPYGDRYSSPSRMRRMMEAGYPMDDYPGGPMGPMGMTGPMGMMGPRGKSVKITENSIIELVDAIKKDDISTFMDLVRSGVDINRLHEDSTPLMYACSYDRQNMVSMILSSGGRVNSKTKDGETAILRCIYNHTILRQLISHGADVNVKTKTFTTPLMYAASRGSIDTVKALLNAGANVHVVSDADRTALEDACNGHKIDVIKLIAEKGGDLNRDGGKALYIACITRQDKEVTECLLKLGADPNLSDVFIEAIKKEKNEIIEVMLKNGADLNCPQPNGIRPLHVAAEADNDKGALMLLRAGAKVNVMDVDGITPIHRAALVLQMPTIYHLLDHGANANPRTRYNINGNSVVCSPYIIAAISPNTAYQSDRRWKTLELIWAAGVSFGKQEWLIVKKILRPEPRPIYEPPTLFDEIIDKTQLKVSKIRTLKEWCRVWYRRGLSQGSRGSMRPIIDRAPLPQKHLKDYLKLADIYEPYMHDR